MNLAQPNSSIAVNLKKELWCFAVDFYDFPGVSEACITLQNEARLDVANLIAVIYADIVLKQPFSVVEIGQLRNLASTWHIEVVLPLRKVRTSLKNPKTDFPWEKEALRKMVKESELVAEQIQLFIVAQWFETRQPQSGLCLSDAQLTLIRQYDYSESNAERLHIALADITAAAYAWTTQNLGNSK